MSVIVVDDVDTCTAGYDFIVITHDAKVEISTKNAIEKDLNFGIYHWR